jgi:hypothetical protein
MPTPSITAMKIAHPIADALAALKPLLTAKAPPVKKPAITIIPLAIERNWARQFLRAAVEDYRDILALYGSSFFLIPVTAQSKVEKSPPHIPKFPPSTGARALMAVRAPMRRSP